MRRNPINPEHRKHFDIVRCISLRACDSHHPGPSRRSLRLLGLVVKAAVLTAAVTTFVDGQVVDPKYWLPNGEVRAVVRHGDVIYLGGMFDRVAPNTGGGAAIDKESGSILNPYLGITGQVSAAVSDGAGGWYIAGSFTSVGNLARNRLAHVQADGTVSSWNPSADAPVYELVVAGSTIYLGGQFGFINGVARSRIAAVDRTTGALMSWSPGAYGNTNGTVHSIVPTQDAVYVGGDFTAIGGQSRGRLAALDPATGSALSWNPNANERVEIYGLLGSSICVGGSFTSIGGQSRNRLAMVDATTGLATEWNPNVNRSVFVGVLSDSTLYIGGDFSAVGGQTRRSIAEVHLDSGLPTDWNPSAIQPSFPDVRAILVDGQTIYIGGTFASVGGEPRENLAAVGRASGLPTDWIPVSGNSVACLAGSDDTIFAGGITFGGALRRHLAALDVSTGELTEWAPFVDGSEPPLGITAIAAAGSTVYVGGYFQQIEGVPRSHLAAIDAGTGMPTSWNPQVDGTVYALQLDDTNAYAAGWFGNVSGTARRNLAGIRRDDASVTAWNPDPNGPVWSILMDGSSVYLGGAFTSVGGQSRSRIASVDVASGAPGAWNPNSNGSVFALHKEGNAIYAGGKFTNVGGAARQNVAALNVVTGGATAWNPAANDTVTAIASDVAAIYLGGKFTSAGGATRSCLAAIDPATAAALDWNPNIVGNPPIVRDVLVDENLVFAGGGFTRIGGVARQTHLVALSPYRPTAGVNAPIPSFQVSVFPNPTSNGATVTWSRSADSPIRAGIYDSMGRRIDSPVHVLGRGQQELHMDLQRLAAGVYWVRVESASQVEAARIVVVR
jgi:hypothetical protein